MHRPQTRPQGCWTCRCATSYGARRQRSMNWRKRQAASMRWRCQEGTRRCCTRDNTIRGLVLCFEGLSGTLPSHTTTCVISASCTGEAWCEGGRRRGPWRGGIRGPVSCVWCNQGAAAPPACTGLPLRVICVGVVCVSGAGLWAGWSWRLLPPWHQTRHCLRQPRGVSLILLLFIYACTLPLCLVMPSLAGPRASLPCHCQLMAQPRWQLRPAMVPLTVTASCVMQAMPVLCKPAWWALPSPPVSLLTCKHGKEVTGGKTRAPSAAAMTQRKHKPHKR